MRLLCQHSLRTWHSEPGLTDTARLGVHEHMGPVSSLAQKQLYAIASTTLQ